MRVRISLAPPGPFRVSFPAGKSGFRKRLDLARAATKRADMAQLGLHRVSAHVSTASVDRHEPTAGLDVTVQRQVLDLMEISARNWDGAIDRNLRSWQCRSLLRQSRGDAGWPGD
jgi:hypothetical protein